ncbi:MAG: Arc family DNA-binding protein [Oscillospiraceae bacterium]
MDKNEKSKKQVPLRLSPSLYDKLAAWAEDDFRSVNGQIEFLLAESVKKHYGKNALNCGEENNEK